MQEAEFKELKAEDLAQDYAQMEKELEQVEAELCVEAEPLNAQDSLKVLRIQIDNELETVLQELGELQAQLPKEQGQKLLQQCADNALNAVVGHFGLAAAVLDSKDGGNVNTTHNVRQDIYASEEERQRYENREMYDSHAYHSDESYIAINKKQTELKKQGQATDYMTGEKLAPNAKTDLDHKIAAKTVHNDRARVLAEKSGIELANTESNLALTDSSLNRMKKDKSAREVLQRRDERLETLQKNQEQKGYLTESEKNELAKLEKQKKIDDERFIAETDDAQKDIDKAVDKAYYTSAKPYKEALLTGAKDAGKMALHSVIGIVLHDLIKGMMIEIKVLVKNFGDESLKEIFARFKNRLQTIWEEIRLKWKDMLKGSIESAIVSFFSNIVVFVINTIFTTLKKIVQIIRAGFTSLYQAIKILINPPKDMPKEDVMREAAKVLVTGLIGATTMLGAAALGKMLETTFPFLAIPLPFTEGETIASAAGLCITAAIGAILSTIVVYYIDKWASGSKESRLQLQIMGKSGEVVQYKVAQSWLVLHDAWGCVLQEAERGIKFINQVKETIAQGQLEMQDAKERRKAASQRRKAAFLKFNEVLK